MLDVLFDRMERVMRGEKQNAIYLPDHPSPTAKESRLSRVVSFGGGRYMLMVGPPGTGKTSYVDSNFVLKPILANLYGKGDQVNVIYRSMERSVEEKIAKLVSSLVFMDRQEIIPPSVMLGYSNAPRMLTKHDIETIRAYTDHFIAIGQRLDIIGGAATSDDVLRYAIEKAKERGSLYNTAGNKLLCNDQVVGEFTQSEVVAGTKKWFAEREGHKIYKGEPKFVPNDKKIYLHVTDHIGKVMGSGGEKDTIDKHSNNMANILRDIIGYGCIDVIQLNREIYNTYRLKNEKLTIRKSDIKGSNVPVENSDIILGVLNPREMNIHDYEGYDMHMFQDPRNNANRFRMLVVVKNSQGADNVNIPLAFYGENGTTYEIPAPADFYPSHAQQIISGNYIPPT